jgi:hypothetical protein
LQNKKSENYHHSTIPKKSPLKDGIWRERVILDESITRAQSPRHDLAKKKTSLLGPHRSTRKTRRIPTPSDGLRCHRRNGSRVRRRYLQDAVAVAGVAEVLEAEVALALGELLAQLLLQPRARRAHHRPCPTPIARRRTVTARRKAILVSGGAVQDKKGLLYWCSETAEIGAEVGGRKKRGESQ